MRHIVVRGVLHMLEGHDLPARQLALGRSVGSGVSSEHVVETAVFLYDEYNVFDRVLAEGRENSPDREQNPAAYGSLDFHGFFHLKQNWNFKKMPEFQDCAKTLNLVAG